MGYRQNSKIGLTAAFLGLVKKLSSLKFSKGPLMSKIFNKSNELYDRALKSIPLASQTFSKSALNFPRMASPLFIEKGEGAYIWDYDGNKYIEKAVLQSFFCLQSLVLEFMIDNEAYTINIKILI